jgi:hypothetical protein
MVPPDTLGSVLGANVTRVRRSIGAKPGGTGSVGSGAGVSWLVVATSRSATWWRAATWLALRGERGDAGYRFKSA